MGSGQSKQVAATALPPTPPASEAKTIDASLPATTSAPAAASASSTSGESGCPMKLPDGGYRMIPGFGSLFGRKHPPVSVANVSPAGSSDSEGGCPVKSQGTPPNSEGGCPVKQSKQYDVYSREIDPKNQMPSVANQLPSAGQNAALPTERISSTIPKGGADDGATWTYPSPQMFYNALARKGKLEDAVEEEIESVVAMHNNMNEGTWSKVLEWEETLNGDSKDTPKLLKFLGRPADLSPKALFKHWIFGHPLPFDRHDWTVLRANGEVVRYVIDYYHDDKMARTDEESAMPNMRDRNAVQSLQVDVRPALDGPSELWGRCVTMPMARTGMLGDVRTDFEPMPMVPTESLKATMDESLELWDNIQKSVAQTKALASGAFGGGDACASDSLEEASKEITPEEAHEIATSFARVLDRCQAAKEALNQCGTDEDCAKASMAVTVCAGSILCPLNHETFIGALTSHGTGDNEEMDDAKVEKALEILGQCVGGVRVRAGEAKNRHPKVFEDVLGKR